MRMAFGLVSLLVVFAIIMLVFSMYEAPVLKRGKTAMDDARSLAGRDEDNAPVTDAITLDAKDRNGRMEAAVVTSITPGSALEKRYGLRAGDEIIQLGPLAIRGTIQSADEAKDFLHSSFQRNEPVVVVRGFEQLTLPLDPKVAAAAAAAPAPVAPPAPAGEASQAAAQEATPGQPAPAEKKPGGLEGQLDLIRNLPGQQ